MVYPGYEKEGPLSQRELRILRGMIDEYEYDRQRRQRRDKMFSGFTGAMIKISAVVAAGVAIAGGIKGLVG